MSNNAWPFDEEGNVTMNTPEMIEALEFYTSLQDCALPGPQYWRGARECLGAFMHITEEFDPAGIIYLLSFNCGVDALVRIELMSLHKKLAKKIPMMVLVGDEHSQREHVVTRLEAFLDVIDGITTS